MNISTLVEPCCAERTLPQLVREMRGVAMFWTNGDVTVQHLFKSLSYMAGPTHRLTLVVRTADVQLCRWVKNWMQRGWTTEVRLTCGEDATALVGTELEGFTDKVSVAVDDTVRDELMAVEGERGVVCIQGRMLTQTVPGITMYACYQGKERGMVGELMAAVEARQRSHRVTMTEARNDGTTEEDEDKDETPEVVAEATETGTKTETETKTETKSKSKGRRKAPQN